MLKKIFTLMILTLLILSSIGTVAYSFTDTDTDGDGLTDFEELNAVYDYKTKIDKWDTDGDGISDYDEIFGTETDWKTDPTKPDTDGDGISDYDEGYMTYDWVTDPNLKDTDHDWISDYDEIFVITDWDIDPAKIDTDDDGLTDYYEITGYETGWKTDPTNPDSDGDGLTDSEEAQCKFDYCTDPNEEDTDLDTISDYDEIYQTYDWPTDPTEKDTDGDGLYDNEEIESYYDWYTDPTKYDTDKDGINDKEEVMGELDYYTDPTKDDTDDDGSSDYDEIYSFTDPTDEYDKPITNQAPEVTYIAIDPNRPETSDNLECNYKVEDPDENDTATVKSIEWFKKEGYSGEYEKTSITTKIVSKTETSNNDYWYCVVTPVDNHGFEGLPRKSSAVRVKYCQSNCGGEETTTQHTPTVVLIADDTTPNTGQLVTFTATGADGNGDNIRYRFDFDNDGTFEIDWTGYVAAGTPSVQTYTYGAVGAYTARVEVEDSTGRTGFTTLAMNVGTPAAGNTAPTITQALSVTPNSGTTGTVFNFAIDANDVDGDPLTVTLTITLPDASTVTPTMVFDVPNDQWEYSYTSTQTGAHSAQATVDDGNGGSVTSASVGFTTTTPTTPPSGGGGGGSSGVGTGAGGGLIVEEIPVIHDTIDYSFEAFTDPEYVKFKIKEDVLLFMAIEEAYGIELTEELIEEIAIATAKASEDLTATRTIHGSEQTGSSILITNYAGEDILVEPLVYEVVPKRFAENADDISTISPNARKYVIKDDPVLAYKYNLVADTSVMKIEEGSTTMRDTEAVREFSAPIIIVREVRDKMPITVTFSKDFAEPGETIDVFGTATYGVKVTLELDGRTLGTYTADEDGSFSTEVSATDAGQHTVHASGLGGEYEASFAVIGQPKEIILPALVDGRLPVYAEQDNIVRMLVLDTGTFDMDITSVPENWIANFDATFNIEGANGETRFVLRPDAVGDGTVTISMWRNGQPFAQFTTNVEAIEAGEPLPTPLFGFFIANAGNAFITLWILILIWIFRRMYRKYREDGELRLPTKAELKDDVRDLNAFAKRTTASIKRGADQTFLDFTDFLPEGLRRKVRAFAKFAGRKIRKAIKNVKILSRRAFDATSKQRRYALFKTTGARKSFNKAVDAGVRDTNKALNNSVKLLGKLGSKVNKTLAGESGVERDRRPVADYELEKLQKIIRGEE